MLLYNFFIFQYSPISKPHSVKRKAANLYVLKKFQGNKQVTLGPFDTLNTNSENLQRYEEFPLKKYPSRGIIPLKPTYI